MQVRLPGFKALDPRQADFLIQRHERVAALFPLYGDLRGILLGIGGLEVVMPRYDELSAGQRRRQHYDTQQIISRARTWLGNDLVLSPMKDSNCHVNVATVRARGRGTIATGFALSEDGLWREHSWLTLDADTVLETTVARLLYHGYVLTRQEQRRFVWSELGLIKWVLTKMR